MNDSEQLPISLVIFDLGGTIVDHGCMAPVGAFVAAFRELGIEISTQQARGPMGLAKLDHIRELFNLAPVTAQWTARYDRSWSEEDVVATYERFLPLQTELAKQHTDVVPGLTECWSTFADLGVMVGTTTGYPREVTGPILDSLAAAGFQPDASVCTDEVTAGRPQPWMIKDIMRRLHVETPQAVVKVGDTVPDMQAARNAGVWAVGITESGSEFGLTKEELAALPMADRDAKHANAAENLRQAGAHAVVRSLTELPGLLDEFASGRIR